MLVSESVGARCQNAAFLGVWELRKRKLGLLDWQAQNCGMLECRVEILEFRNARILESWNGGSQRDGNAVGELESSDAGVLQSQKAETLDCWNVKIQSQNIANLE